MSGSCIVYEYDAIVAESAGLPAGAHAVPARVFSWLESECHLGEDARWIRMASRHGKRAIQVTGYVGVIRAPCGFQIEVLPKTGKSTSESTARELLVRMLSCLGEFRHILTEDADLSSARLSLYDVFIQHFLETVQRLVRQGLRGGYVNQQGTLAFLRGKLLIAQQIRRQIVRRDRFEADFDEFLQDRPENRLIHTALGRAMGMCRSEELRRQARELRFVFSDIPESKDIQRDFQSVRLERDMARYERPLAWSRLILTGMSPLTGAGQHRAPSLLFPMDALFEAFVAQHIPKQLAHGFRMKAQARSQYLAIHQDKQWFQLKPDLLIQQGDKTIQVLDTKWKLIDASLANRREKYQLSQSDFYQLYAYGHYYLDGKGDVVLIYPKTDHFETPLPPFTFRKQSNMRLWILPFCLQSNSLLIPDDFHMAPIYLSGDVLP